MLGFHAEARTTEITIDYGELEDARWFTREEVRAGGDALLPFAHSISRRLIVTWLEEQTSSEQATP
jgi:NAD+ diphosphatase